MRNLDPARTFPEVPTPEARDWAARVLEDGTVSIEGPVPLTDPVYFSFGGPWIRAAWLGEPDTRRRAQAPVRASEGMVVRIVGRTEIGTTRGGGRRRGSVWEAAPGPTWR